MSEEDKLILGTLAGVDLVLSPEHYEEYKGTLNKQLEQKDKEIDRLNNVINKVKQQLLNKKDIVEKSKYFKLFYYTDWNMQHEWDKTIVKKIDEIINIIEEANK